MGFDQGNHPRGQGGQFQDDVQSDDPREITEDVEVAPDASVPAEVEERLEEEREGDEVGE